MKTPDPFTHPPLTAENMDLYVIRSGILRALKRGAKEFGGRFLDVGSGREPYREWLMARCPAMTEYVGLDLEGSTRYKDATVTWDGVRMPFADASFDCAMATEVLEHCPEPEVTLREVARVLKPGGVFFFTVPFLWPLHDCPHDEYRYTPWSMERHLRRSGFAEVHLRPTGGWDAALAQALGLWVRRSPTTQGRKRRWLTRAVFPVYKWLVNRDATPSKFTHASFLMTGMTGLARTGGGAGANAEGKEVES